MVLRPMLKQYVQGTHRFRQPSETLAAILPFTAAMGVTRVANVTGLDTIGIPVVMVTRPNSRSISVSQGKGVDLTAAKVSGLMESIESYHAERITLPVKHATFEDLFETHDLIDITRLPRLSTSRFSPYQPILWIEGRDLIGDRAVWLPYEIVHLNYTVPLPPGHGSFIASSNGLASGNTLTEAIIHGICEVVERDAATLWHLMDEAEQDRRRIDPNSVDDPQCRMMLDRYRFAGVSVGIWEITSNTGIPAFLCRIIQDETPPNHSFRPAVGMGCHPSRGVALSRALSEAAQSRLTFIAGARDDMPKDEYDTFLDSEIQSAWRARLNRSGVRRRFADGPGWYAEDMDTDLEAIIDRLRAVGITELAVVDLTKEEFGIPVVRVVIPGLEGIDHSPDYLLGPRAQAIVGVAA